MTKWPQTSSNLLIEIEENLYLQKNQLLIKSSAFVSYAHFQQTIKISYSYSCVKGGNILNIKSSF